MTDRWGEMCMMGYKMVKERKDRWLDSQNARLLARLSGQSLPVECIKHFNGHKDRQRHSHWLRGLEDVTVNTLEHPRFCRALHMMRLQRGAIR